MLSSFDPNQLSILEQNKLQSFGEGSWEVKGGNVVSNPMTEEEAQKMQSAVGTILGFTPERINQEGKIQLTIPRDKLVAQSMMSTETTLPVIADVPKVVAGVQKSTSNKYEQRLNDYRQLIPNRIADSAPIAERFANLAQVTHLFKPATYNEYETNARFRDVLCPKETAVTLPITVTSTDEEDVTSTHTFNSPIHANHVRLAGQHTICAQAPQFDSYQGDFARFWQAVLQNSHVIMDLTNFGDTIAKNGVQPYFPENKGVEQKYQSMRIRCDEQKGIENNPHFTINRYHVRDESKTPPAESTIYRIQYRGWPDHGSVSTDQLESIVLHFQQFRHEHAQQLPAIIHCLAGVGRTGTTAVALALDEMLKKGEVNEKNYLHIIDALILTGREQRGNKFVERLVQYESLIKLVEKRLNIVRTAPTQSEASSTTMKRAREAETTPIKGHPDVFEAMDRSAVEKELQDSGSWLIRYSPRAAFGYVLSERFAPGPEGVRHGELPKDITMEVILGKKDASKMVKPKP